MVLATMMMTQMRIVDLATAKVILEQIVEPFGSSQWRDPDTWSEYICTVELGTNSLLLQ